MKGEERILPKTEITTTYDENGKLITEVTEDYEEDRVSVKFPLKWLTGSVNPDTMEITPADYTIEIYQTEDARDPVSKPVIKMKDDPFVLKFYHHDHLGTVRYITNESGEILHTTDTLAYGEELTAPYEGTNDKVLNTITYTGHEKDYETNLTYMLARYYSQGYGRFLSPDPGYDYDQLDPMSWNLYAYVRGNPVNFIDKNGKEIYLKDGNKVVKFVIGKYYDPKKYGKKIHRMAQALTSLMRIHKKLNKLVRDLVNSKHKHTMQIKCYVRNHKVISNVVVYNKGGRDTQIYVNGLMGNQDVENPNKMASPLSVLAHELKHAWDNDKGFKEEDVALHGVPIGEIRAVYYENIVRARTYDGRLRKTYYTEQYGTRIITEEMYKEALGDDYDEEDF